MNFHSMKFYFSKFFQSCQILPNLTIFPWKLHISDKSANLPSQVSPLQNTAAKNLFQEIIAKNFFLRHCIFPLLTHFSAILIKTEGICFSLMQEKSESKQSRFGRVTSSRKLIILGNFNHRQFYGPHL